MTEDITKATDVSRIKLKNGAMKLAIVPAASISYYIDKGFVPLREEDIVSFVYPTRKEGGYVVFDDPFSGPQYLLVSTQIIESENKLKMFNKLKRLASDYGMEDPKIVQQSNN